VQQKWCQSHCSILTGRTFIHPRQRATD
jgi:hypothetical protein